MKELGTTEVHAAVSIRSWLRPTLADIREKEERRRGNISAAAESKKKAENKKLVSAVAENLKAFADQLPKIVARLGRLYSRHGRKGGEWSAAQLKELQECNDALNQLFDRDLSGVKAQVMESIGYNALVRAVAHCGGVLTVDWKKGAFTVRMPEGAEEPGQVVMLASAKRLQDLGPLPVEHGVQ